MIPSYIVAGAISDTIRQLPASGELEEKERIPRTSHQMDTWGGIQMHILGIYVSKTRNTFFAKNTSQLSTAAMQGSEQPRDGHFQS